ncbi:MAG: hydroxymethylbilane synthase, partial [Clostridium tyrobutyricum]|nr:hydroxymethylbilane synthase [Clostridium tyrobutyricum]
MKFKIATRKSKLAQVQTEIVMDLVKRICGSESEKVLIETTGDKRLDIALNKIGGKGLFIKEIERALLNNEVDAAVHSMKDVPFDIMDEFEIAAICKREDARDVFVSNGNVHFKNLRIGAQIGTSSNRRAAQIKKLRSDLNITPIRGNVQTRIDKMISQGLDGIVLAAAGVMRLNMEEIITDYFSIENVVPAIGQGALGVEIRSNSKHKNTFTKLNDENSRKCVEAERSFMRALNGDCHSTIGAYAEI